MGLVGRLLGMLLIVLILLMTPCAFWVFNLERVALDPQTYRTALQTQNVYNDLLPALVDGAASDSNLDSDHREALRALLNNMSVEDWATLADKLLPPSWLQQQVEGNIERFFTWLDGARATPGISFDLQALKTKLSGQSAQEAVAVIVPKLPECTPDQVAVLQQVAQGQAVGNAFPLCSPQAADLRQTESAALLSTLNAVGRQLPSRWDLNEQIRKADVSPGTQHLTEFDLNRFRAVIWFQSRASLVLFLIPLALLFLIVIVTIRSGKQFFRWTGWGLIASGLLTLLPVPFMPGLLLGTFAGPQANMQADFGDNARLLASLISGMVHSVVSGLTMAVLLQVAVVIAIGFVAVLLSVLLPAPEPDVTRQDLLLEQSQLAAQMASDPFSLGMTPVPAGSTPRPVQPATSPPMTRPLPPESEDDETII
jgi:hypothetical protein